MPATPPPSLSPLPAAPDRADRVTFSSRATAMFAALKDVFVGQVNAIASNVYGNAQSAESAATAAGTSATAAATSATSAGTSASNAATSATSAGSSATNAAASASSASASAAAAAASAATAAGVTTVNGRSGTVTLTKSDVGLGSVDNVPAASLRDRATHTGVQAMSTVSGLQTALDGLAASSGGAAFKNRIINGEMEIAQRGGAFPAIASGAYSLDRWSFGNTSTAVGTVTQQADAPGNNEFRSSFRYAVTTAKASIAAGDVCWINQRIEGYNIRDLVGKTFTLSFWVRSSKTGVHCVAFKNSGASRSFLAEYSINAANTWEYKTITVSGGLITAGTWDFANGLGLRVDFALACGATYQSTAGTWQTGDFYATSNQANCLDATSNIFAITGVQLEVGSSATSFEHRPYGVELALCQRYLPAVTGGDTAAVGVGTFKSATQVYVACCFPVEARVRPTGVTVTSPSMLTIDAAAGVYVSSAISATVVQSTKCGVLSVAVAGATVGQAALVYFNGNAGAAGTILFTGCEL